VQRALSAKNIHHGRGGTIFAGFLKILPVFLMVIPGLISRALFPEQVKASPNLAYVLLVQNVLPTGARGLMIAAMLAALMSTLASVFHSSATLFTMDIYRPLKDRFFNTNNNGQPSEAEKQQEEQQQTQASEAETTVSLPEAAQVEGENEQEIEIELVSASTTAASKDAATEATIAQTPMPPEDEERQFMINSNSSNDGNEANQSIIPNQVQAENSTQNSATSSTTLTTSTNSNEYVLVGRIAAIVITIMGIAWIPLVPLLSQQLYIYTHKIMSYFAPSIAIVFLFGVLIPRVNHYGALATLLSGLVIGMSRLILELVYATTAPQDMFILLQWFVKMNFLHFSAFFAAWSMAVLVLVSLITKKPSESQTEQLTIKVWFKNNKEANKISKESNNKREWIGTAINIGATIVLAMSLFALYFIFR